ncbi:5645_t:CDS:1, partial [Cetraspora pellucida]
DYIKKPEQIIVATLESKLLNLQETHSKTVTEYSEIKSKYEECLSEIHELQQQLTEEKLRSDIFDSDSKSSAPSTPTSPTTPITSKSRFHNLKRNINSDRMSLPPILNSNEPNDKCTASPKRANHRRAKSLTEEFKDKEKRDQTHAEIVQKLQRELKQLELLHRDKSQGLDAVKQEFARLQCTHREALEIVEELKEEIKRRDVIVQSDDISVIASEYTDGVCSAATSELDEHEIREVEHNDKNLEIQLNEAKESISMIADPTQKTIDMLEANLLALQQELSSKSDLIENLTSETELVAELRSRLETLKLDINSKHELIEAMKKDLSDK